MIRFINNFIVISIILVSSLSYAKTGALFQISESGNALSADIILCLSGKGPFSCQNYHVNADTLAINPVPQHTYPGAGIKILTPNYKITGCTPYTNGYCLFTMDWQIPATIVLNNS